MGFVLGDIGRHEDAQAVTRRAIQLNPTLSRAHANLAIERQRVRARRNKRRAKRELQVSGEGQLARYNLGLAFRSKGYYAEALREYGVALERGEERDLVLQAMAEMHLLMRHPNDALALYDDLLTATAVEPEAVERARRRAASGRAIRRGGGELSPRARRGAGVRDRAQQPRRLALSSRRRRRGERRVSTRARGRADVRRRRGSISRCC